MADIFTIKVFGKDVKYIKKGGKFYRIKANGQVAKDSASGLRLSNLKNKDSDLVKKVGASETKKIVSQFKVPIGVKKVAASTLDDGGKAALDKKFPNRNVVLKAKEKEKKALDIIKKDASNTKTDAKPPKPKAKPKSITKMRTKDVKMVTLKDGTKGTIKQRLAEIDKEKEMAEKKTKFESPKEAKKRSDYFRKLASSLKTKKASRGGTMMKKKTKYMAKGGAGMKKTKYMAKGGMKKPMTMKKTMGYARGGAAKKK